MATIDRFIFLLLAAGEVLKISKTVSAQKIQDFMAGDESFGLNIRFPLADCRLALTLLENSALISKSGVDGEYERYRS